MSKLETNVRNTWGEKGNSWLQKLPAIIDDLAKLWNLSDIRPVTNLSYNYVALATQGKDKPVALKFSCDEQLIQDEYKALQHFSGLGSIKVLEINERHHAMLLQQAIPGDLLKNNHSINFDETIISYAEVVKNIASVNTANNDFTHVSYWCKAVDRIQDSRVDEHYIRKAQELREYLLGSAEVEYVCHGDLHLENIVKHGDCWLSIDPKGTVGEMAFEAAAFDLIDSCEWEQHDLIQEKLKTRINRLAIALKVDEKRLRKWFFLRAVISAQWFIEDGGNPDVTLSLVKYLYLLV